MIINVNPIKTLGDRLRLLIAVLLRHDRPVIFNRRASESVLKPITHTFKFKSGAVKEVKLQVEAMAGFQKALKLCPSLEIAATSTSAYSGSFRTHAQQAWLYSEYKAGRGHLAAPPYTSWHEAGLACDILNPDVKDPGTHRTPREAMLSVGFHDYLPNDPPHHTWRVSTATNKTYPKPPWVHK